MYFEQFYLSCLAHASCMIGSDGIAAVVDSQRDVEQYIEEAQKNGLHIAHVIETHLHADFVSAHRELARAHGHPRGSRAACSDARAWITRTHEAPCGLAEGALILPFKAPIAADVRIALKG